MGKGLSEDELKALVATEQRQAMGYSSSKLSASRQKAEYYYLGLPVGDLSPPEIDGRSSVVSTDVRDTIEAMLPQLMVTFCGGDKVAEFEPQSEDDEQKANLATEYINYLFFKKNNGHALSYTWMKDALLQKNGIVKVWWDTRHEQKKEEYRALDEVELAQIMDDPEVEVTEQTSYPDEDDAKQRTKALQQMAQQLQQAMQAAQQGNPQAQQAVQQMGQHMQQMQSQPPAMLYDITCVRKKTEGKITIENVPPEEFLISRSAKNIQDAKFVGHRVQRTISELTSMGYKNLENIGSDGEGQSNNIERIQRLSFNDENAYLSDELSSSDESQKRIWVVECYIRCDFDGDGISELRKVTVAGDRLLDNEEVDFTPFVSICPVPLPHTFFGLSIADLSMESQKTKTSILRAQLDNMYLGVNGRYFAVEGQVNLDDLLTSRPGGVVRMKSPGMAGRLDQGQGNSGEAAHLMEYMQQDLENRTGWSRMSMGNSAAGLNQTATSANIVTNKADMRVDLIARNFAEGYTELFRYILKLVCQHQNKAAMTRVAGVWTDIDPREWRNQFDVNINVGIGMGNKDQKVQHMLALIAQQEKVFPLGVANPEGIHESSVEFAKLLGFKNGDKFFNDPKKNPPPPKPDPDQQKLQGMMQLEQMKQQGNAQSKQAELQAQAQVEQAKIQFQTQSADADRSHEAQLEQFKAQLADQQQQRETQAKALSDERNAQLQAQLQAHEQTVQAQQNQHQNELEAAREVQKAQLTAELASQKYQQDSEVEQRRISFDRWKVELAESTKVVVAQITSKIPIDPALMAASQFADETVANGGVSDTQNMIEMQGKTLDAINGVLQHLAKPKTITRGADGRATGIA